VDSSSDPDEESTNSVQLGLYKIEGILGEGLFGNVHLGSHVLSGLKVAIKHLKKAQFEELKQPYPPVEVDVLKRLTLCPHPNLVQLFDIIETSSRIYMIQEYISGGELYDLCVSKYPFPEDMLQNLFVQVVKGLSWLHLNGIAHRDLKLENVLLDHNQTVKIIDLGLATFFNGAMELEEFCGSPDYAAPELYMRKKYNGYAVDIWALAVML
jgi:serine/threonine protein kinase